MKRTEFFKTCGALCLGGALVAEFLQSCKSTHYAVSEQSGTNLKVMKTEFELTKNGQTTFRSYIIVNPEKLNFPIYLYRMNESEYSALWMECTHQGAELTAHGEYLTCAAHGSEFDKNGNVTQGPAQKSLRRFKTSDENDFILISLS